MSSLRTRSAVNTAKYISILAIALFASSGTPRYWHAWGYLGLQLVGMAATNEYLLRRNRPLMERRLLLDEKGETEPTQKLVIALMRIVGLLILVAAGLDRRFVWSRVPVSVAAGAAVAFAAGTLIVFLVFRENSYTSSIIEVVDRQPVVATGPYRVVRHPMYAGVLLMGLATPPLLGSYWAALLLLPSIVLMVVRLVAEERFLSQRLPGYLRYLQDTPSRLVPGVW